MTCFNKSDSLCPFPVGPAILHLSSCIFKDEKYVDILGEVESQPILLPAMEMTILIALVQYRHVDIY